MSAGGLDTLFLAITAFVTALTPIVLALINRRQTRDARVAAGKAEDVRVSLEAATAQTTQQLEQIQHTVNSERDKLLAKIEELRLEVYRLAAYKELREQQDERGQR